jgi:hypothetical protein
MAAFNANDIVRTVVKIIGQAGDVYENVYHHQYTGPGSSIIATAFSIGAWVSDLYNIIQPNIPGDVTISSFDVTNVTQKQVYAEEDIPDIGAGGGTGDTMPEQCCALVLGRTARPKTVGRKFLGPFIESQNADGNWGSDVFNTLDNFAIAWLTDIDYDAGNSHLSPVVVHYTGGGEYTTVTPLDSFAVSSQIYTQRRRRRGFGG